MLRIYRQYYKHLTNKVVYKVTHAHTGSDVVLETRRRPRDRILWPLLCPWPQDVPMALVSKVKTLASRIEALVSALTLTIDNRIYSS